MSKRSDQQYLLNKQYRDAANLKARINLHTRFKTNSYDWFRFVFDQFNLPQDASILELGCGPGNLWAKNLDRIPQSWEITLSDFSPGMLAEAQQNLSSTKHPFIFKLIDAQQIPVGDGQLNAVIANHMLYHVPDRSKAIAEIARVLKPDGVFYAATNGQQHLSELDELYGFLVPDFRDVVSTFSSDAFTLENGGAQLAPWFHSDIRVYEDSLVITETEPLLAYIKSMIPFDELQIGQDKLASLQQLIDKRINSEGSIRIIKSTGVFVSHKLITPFKV